MPDPAEPDPAPPERPVPTSGELFRSFFAIGIIGFGGVLPFARRMIVEQRRWLTPVEFTDLLALCQFLPGPNICNLSVSLGARFRGAPGAVAALFGLMLAPMAIVMALTAIYLRHQDSAVLRHAFTGLAAAASGLVIAMSAKIAAPLRGSAPGVVVAMAMFVVIAVLRLPLLPSIVVAAPLSVWFVRHFSRRRTA